MASSGKLLEARLNEFCESFGKFFACFGELLENFGEFYQVFCKFLAFLVSFYEFLANSGEFLASIVEKNSSKKFTFTDTYNVERVRNCFLQKILT